jgi:hypothetical protein
MVASVPVAFIQGQEPSSAASFHILSNSLFTDHPTCCARPAITPAALRCSHVNSTTTQVTQRYAIRGFRGDEYLDWVVPPCSLALCPEEPSMLI